MNIKLAIFDFDGTIMDTRETIITAKQETMRQLGLPVADEAACAATIGLATKAGFKAIFPDADDKVLDELVLRYRKIFEETRKVIIPTLFPGMIEVLEQLKESGVVCTVATSRNRSSLDDFLKELDIDSYFTYTLAAEDTSLLKPNPDPVLKTLADLSVNADNAIVIGDMPVDILMGKGAGAYTCGVTYGNSDRDSLLASGADYVIDSISELMTILGK